MGFNTILHFGLKSFQSVLGGILGPRASLGGPIRLTECFVRYFGALGGPMKVFFGLKACKYAFVSSRLNSRVFGSLWCQVLTKSSLASLCLPTLTLSDNIG